MITVQIKLGVVDTVRLLSALEWAADQTSNAKIEAILKVAAQHVEAAIKLAWAFAMMQHYHRELNLALANLLTRPKLARLHVHSAMDAAIWAGRPELAWSAANLLEACHAA